MVNPFFTTFFVLAFAGFAVADFLGATFFLAAAVTRTPAFFDAVPEPFALVALGADFFDLLTGLALPAVFFAFAGADLPTALRALVGFGAGFFFFAMWVDRGAAKGREIAPLCK